MCRYLYIFSNICIYSGLSCTLLIFSKGHYNKLTFPFNKTSYKLKMQYLCLVTYLFLRLYQSNRAITLYIDSQTIKLIKIFYAKFIFYIFRGLNFSFFLFSHEVNFERCALVVKFEIASFLLYFKISSNMWCYTQLNKNSFHISSVINSH